MLKNKIYMLILIKFHEPKIWKKKKKKKKKTLKLRFFIIHNYSKLFPNKEIDILI